MWYSLICSGKPPARWFSQSGEPNTNHICEFVLHYAVTLRCYVMLLHYAVTLRKNAQVCTLPKMNQNRSHSDMFVPLRSPTPAASWDRASSTGHCTECVCICAPVGAQKNGFCSVLINILCVDVCELLHSRSYAKNRVHAPFVVQLRHCLLYKN